MKMFRKATTLLCILALLLSLAPAAFAAEDGADEPIVVEKVEIIEEPKSESAVKEPNEQSSFVYEEGSVEIKDTGSITITNKVNDDAGSAIVDVQKGNLVNNGTISGSALVGNPYTGEAEVHASEGIENIGTIELTGGRNTHGVNAGKPKADVSVKTEGDLINDSIWNEDTKEFEKVGTITLDGGNAIVSADGKLENFGDITLTATKKGTLGDSGNATVSAGGKLENFGDITLTATDKATMDVGEGSENWGTITVNGAEVSIDTALENMGIINKNGAVYYGVSYWEDNNEGKFDVKSAFDSWEEGLAAQGKSITLKQTADNTRDGYTFGGWRFEGKDYAGGDTVTYDLDSPKFIEAIWNKILAAAPSGGGGEEVTAEKSKEKIVKYMDGYKVLDADRKEMKMENEYFNVAKTSYGRLIVVFTWQQMAEMEEGEHLFYIVSPDNVETEYTLTIW